MIALPLFGAACNDDDDENGGSASVDMELIPAGSFTMGDARGIYEQNERPARTVSLDAFYMSRTEITQQQYEDVMGANPSSSKAAKQPVEKVTWHDALRFCNALSEREGLQPVYTDIEGNLTADFKANGFRLPTEAEWEYACRAGTSTTYYTGETVADLSRCAWFTGNADGRPHDVGQLEANDFGLHDMHGNVFEWCWDWFGRYTDNKVDNPLGRANGNRRIIRGGSWAGDADKCMTSYRASINPAIAYYFWGIRLCRSN